MIESARLRVRGSDAHGHYAIDEEAQMKPSSILAAMLIGIFSALADPSYGAEAAYKFKIVDIPIHGEFLGRAFDDIIRLTDINNQGQIAGNGVGGEGFFINLKHKAKEIRCPGDQTDNESTTVSAINNAGQIVGSCSDGGFIRDRNGKMTILNFPGADGTVALGINDFGHVVGQYWGTLFGEGLQRFHGFVWKHGSYTTVDSPFSDAMSTSLWGINNSGQIIGTYLHHRTDSADINDYDGELAFLYDSGDFIPLDFPGAQIPFCCGAQTFPMDINNRGHIIGSSYSSEGELQFFLLADGDYLTITGLPDDVVDAGSWGINDNDEIAGTYVQAVPCDSCGVAGEPGHEFVTHAFVAKPHKSSKKNQPVN